LLPFGTDWANFELLSPALGAERFCAAGSDGKTNFGTTWLAVPTPYLRGSLDTPSPRGWTSPDRDPAPILTCDRALLLSVDRNQARIDGKAFAAN
jgi:hypothetical protein